MQTSTQAVRARTDEPFLERFIEAHEAFVLRCASRHAGFAVTRSDDEYSVALLAFYEAVKGYDPASGPFGAYASLVIGRRLADHYRSQHRFDAETPLAPQTFDGTVDRESADAAMQQAVAEQMSEAKPVSAQDEIEAANTVFEKYGFAFYDLAASSPKSDKTRRSCAAAVGTLLHSPVLFASMQSAHSLPIKALAQQCGVSARTITRHRDYIVAAALLIDGDYPILCTYLQTMRKEAGFEVVDRIHVTVKTADEKLAQIVEANADAIERGVLALDVTLGDAPEGAYVRDWSINGVDATLSVAKA